MIADLTPRTAHGVYLGLETPSFFIWLGAAMRIAQLLGLHKLGSDPSIMPRDHEDPAWPVQACSLKREMAKRIWHFGASLDQLFATRAGMGSIGLGTCESAGPRFTRSELSADTPHSHRRHRHPLEREPAHEAMLLPAPRLTPSVTGR